jgi:hypothetical protein
MKNLLICISLIIACAQAFCARPAGFTWNETNVEKITKWMNEDKQNTCNYDNLIKLAKYDKTITIEQYNKELETKLCKDNHDCYVRIIFCVGRFRKLAKDINFNSLNNKEKNYYNKHIKKLLLKDCGIDMFSNLFRDVIKNNVDDKNYLVEALNHYEKRMIDLDSTTIKNDMKYAKKLIMPKLTDEKYKLIVVKIELILKSVE